MGFSNKLNTTLRDFINQQPMFFVATAGADGTVNLSPKGLDGLRILDDQTLVWLNLSGSGNETAAHLRDTNRMTLMFCAFEGEAMILRLYGTAETVHPRDEGWDERFALFPNYASARQIFVMQIARVQTSCGTGVPLMEYRGQRGEAELDPWYAEMGADGLRAYWARKNVESIDGKPTGIFED